MEHFHVHDPSPGGRRSGKKRTEYRLDRRGKFTAFPHYHYVVRKREGPGKFIVLDPIDYWFGIDQYKKRSWQKASILARLSSLVSIQT